jgi:AcrR family transcriptional regulator
MSSKDASPSGRSQATRNRILEAARELFNAQGTGPVSTNHIAAAARLSPGNLYYHFKDKKQIIRELHTRLAAAFENAATSPTVNLVPAGAAPALLGLRRLLDANLALIWEYRFFQRELLALLRADPELRGQYTRIYQQRLSQWSELCTRLVAAGLVRPFPDQHAQQQLMLTIWLVAENWLAFQEITGGIADHTDQLTPADFAGAADLVLALLTPQLTDLGHTELNA